VDLIGVFEVRKDNRLEKRLIMAEKLDSWDL
jgi:hypothetical protein